MRLFALALALCCADCRAQEMRISLEGPPPARAQPQFFASRDVSVIKGEQLKDYPAHSVPELLDYIAGADIRKRGPYGALADAGLDGATNEQTLILVDGVRVSNSQTGHFNMDLPLTQSDIERIEVLRGQACSIYGAGAIGGAINIITKNPRRRAQAAALGGEYATAALSASAANEWGKFGQSISAENARSDGARYDTGFDRTAFFSKSALGKTAVSLGYLNNDYGAYDYYTPGKNYPSREWTSAYFANAASELEYGPAKLRPEVFFIRHDDTFQLDRTRPQWYVNNHTTHYRGARLSAAAALGETTASLGVEAAQDEIASSSMGNHTRDSQSLFGGIHAPFGSGWTVDASARADGNDGLVQFSPAIAASFRPAMRWRLRAGTGVSYRLPSFTDMYYNDPVNTGNPSLSPEHAVSYDAGADYSCGKNCSASATVFLRNQKDVIDWAGPSPTGPWQAQNIGDIKVRGINGSLAFAAAETDWNLQYSWTDSTRHSDLYSKYALAYGYSQMAASGRRSILGINCLLAAIYRKREGMDNYFLLNAKLSKNLRGGAEVFLEGNNLLNTGYQEISGIPMPGRWINAGLSWKL
ncbi:MAG: TonB-dependent receptor [Elusimicrobiales bacterium]